MSTYDSHYQKLCLDFIAQKEELEAAKIKLLSLGSRLDGWFLARSNVNEFVEASLNNLIERAKAFDRLMANIADTIGNVAFKVLSEDK